MSKHWLGVVACVGTLMTAQSALAAVECNRMYGAVTIDDDVIVRGADRCVLVGTTVTGSVFVEMHGWLDSYGSTVLGSVLADSAFLLRLADSHVEGHVESLFCGYDTPCGVIRSDVGSLSVEYSSPPFGVRDSLIRGDVHNVGGITYFRNNTVEGSLTCEPKEFYGLDFAVFRDNEIAGEIDPICFE